MKEIALAVFVGLFNGCLVELSGAMDGLSLSTALITGTIVAWRAK